MQVSAIHTYPIKGCRRLDHDSAVVEPWGLQGDRRWLVTDPDGVAVTQREVATLALLRANPGPDGLTLSYAGREPFLVPHMKPDATAEGDVFGARVAATPAGKGADVWLSEALQRDVRLVWLDDPTRRLIGGDYATPSETVSFADGYPLLLTNNASLRQLNEWMDEPLPMTRFRPNIVIDSDRPFAEDEWTGRSVHIGEIEFRVAEPCGRCVVTTTDQETGERGKEPLRALAKHRNVDQKLLFGANLIPAQRGVVRVGDQVS
ncbi:molybdenum cofactor biosysynthesis protein [Rhizocola hellebori]|uniref:Molybdenum cofactor biosysynthesis protein n=1 Tax=Rhizocola hellebori TaxID=1392758 RepID=A0A8J3VIG5_9ACTN|nr:MOSC N-terminal beta barrel domain-containing protein [Rhizocola hellebori]GIH07031.1 molybdenum cofactor biosysynthesis protein [Rhizocola hellebori]